MSLIWKKIRNLPQMVVATAADYFLARMSRTALLNLGNFIGNRLFNLDMTGRAIALANLELVFPKKYLPREKNNLIRQSYRNRWKTYFDQYWLARQSSEVLSNLVDVVGFEEFKTGEKPGVGRVFASAHIGNFELLPTVTSWLGMPTMAIGTGRGKEGHGAELVPKERAALRMLKVLKRGRSCALLVDRIANLNEPGHLINCFGRKKWSSGIHVILSSVTKARLVPVMCLPIENNRYEFRFFPELKRSTAAGAEKQLAQLCWDQWEPIIRERPECWMWNYPHWGYRPANAPDYPVYAKVDKRFQKIYEKDHVAK